MLALQGQAGEEDPAGPDRWRSAAWLSQLLVNDLEPAARRLCPAIAPLRDALLASGAVAAGLSGSGPTTFGIFSDAPAASEALAGARVRAALSTAASAASWTGVARTLRSAPRG
ncbi:MAG: hypothetical protein HKP30_16060 [Myxococcales bacterium]|nr:hypothetical protein [Myxococcales bacterium]